LIGVISKKSEVKVVEEFFQLFKVPWEFFRPNGLYDVVLSTRNELPEPVGNVVFIYSSETGKLDFEKAITRSFRNTNLTLQWEGVDFPIYGNILTFGEIGKPVIRVKSNSRFAGVEISEPQGKVFRIGYDLFAEVSFLLSSGQPAENAHIPTLEIHISILRNLILDSGIPLIEIPPMPAGKDFIVCLTHDVDFMGIYKHKFDHTMWGFVYRAFVGSFLDRLKKRASWKKMLQNWKSVALLPYVFLGIADDFWLQFKQYMEIEKDLKSTFFLIPFKNRAGCNTSDQDAKRRAAPYDITDIKSEVQYLMSLGREVGVHGIDAWCDSEKGARELDRVAKATGESDIGIRIHWLYFCARSFQTLEKAGFSYDSSFGYNDAVGYRPGTTQVFLPLSVEKLLELPLHIQDTALFYPKRMGLTEAQALEVCKKIVRNASKYGGVLTMNWHHRSLAPERLWGGFYINLLEEIKAKNVWFATAGQVVRWYSKRRAVLFDEVLVLNNTLRLKLRGHRPGAEPPIFVRIYQPVYKDAPAGSPASCKGRHLDITWAGEPDLEISW